MGAGDGTFAAAVAYPLAAPDPISVTAADLDMDGDIDLLVDSRSGGGDFLQLFRNSGTGVFAAGINLSTGVEEPAFPVVADLNHDGTPDIAAGSRAELLGPPRQRRRRVSAGEGISIRASSRSSVAPPT